MRSSSRTGRVLGSLLAILTVGLVSCTINANKIVNEAKEYYDDDELGYEVDDFDWDDVEGDQEATHLTRTQTATIKIDGEEEASHQVRVTEYDYYVDVDDPKTGTQTLEVEDLTTDNFRALSFAPLLGAILIESDDTAVTVVKNPDGSYTVDDQPVANGRAVVELLDENPIFADASPHGMLLAYAMAQKASPWTSLMKSCVGPQPPPGAQGQGAEPGAVCAVFQDFCDCTACFKLNKLDSCQRCPQ